MSTPTEPQVQGPTDPASAGMVRVCDRCGTVCAADQEWCLNCGVRMTETSQRLPGLRAAGVVVALAVLLAGGAAAASYAALRGDARKTANVPGPTTTTPPVAAAPAPTTPVTPAPVAPTASTPTTTTAPTKKSPTTTQKKATPTPTPTPTPAPSTGNATPNPGAQSTPTTTAKTTPTTPTKTTPKAPSGPITFASGQGSIYDPDSTAADVGDEGNAIDGSTKTSWKVTLKAGQTGGLGYVLDFDDPTTISKLKISTPTAGLKVKILGTSKSKLPEDVLDNGWDTIASEATMKSGTNSVALKAVSGAKTKYRHVLVLFTTVPGSPASATIREFTASH